jgi:hypothetical protein
VEIFTNSACITASMSSTWNGAWGVSMAIVFQATGLIDAGMYLTIQGYIHLKGDFDNL